MTNLVILTGPQGSGNHLFSKFFSSNSHVHGWDANAEYWLPHSTETFNECWQDPNKLEHFDFSKSEFWFTSISCPFMKNGEFLLPNYSGFINKCTQLGIKVQVVVIGRDKNVLTFQEQRVRGNVTHTDFSQFIPFLLNYTATFVSLELAYLYGYRYIKHLFDLLGYPSIYLCERTINTILETDSNTKYFSQVELQELDKVAKHVSGIKC